MNKMLLSLLAYCLFVSACKKTPPAEEQFPSEDFIKSGDYLGDYWPTAE